MATLRVRNENGQIEDREVISRNVTVVPEDIDSFDPAVVQRVEYDDEGGMSQITTVCGETENRRESDKGTNYTVEGIVTNDNLEALKSLSEGQQITLVSDIETEEVTVKRTTIEQNTDIIHFTPNGGDQMLAFGFQLQLKQPES